MARGKLVNFDPEYNNLPKPEKKTVLDDETKYSNVDLIKHIDDDHIIKKIALSIAECKFTAYPASTAFLITISVFSGYAGRAYKVARHCHDVVGIPLGIYAVCEQPSGSGKDLAINIVSDCFNDALRDFLKSVIDTKKEIDNRIDKAIDDNEGNKPKNCPEFKALTADHKKAVALIEAIENYNMDLSDTTAEGLEVSLIDSGGHFTLASSEQELFDVLLCGQYSNGKTNKGLILKAFDGGRISVKRQGRTGFKGTASGSFTLFSQPGSMQKLYESSGYTGLAERFLKLFEPNRGGKRDFVNGKAFNYFLIEDLNEKLKPIIDRIINQDSILSPKPFYDLPILRFSEESMNVLNHFRNEMEKTVDVGGVYHDSKISMLGTVTKCDIQVQKMAACLHLLDDGYYDDEIAHKHVISAINIIRDILLSYADLMENKGMTGNKAYYERVIDYLSKQSKPRTEREIIQNLKGRRPFDMESPNKVIKETLSKMLQDEILRETLDVATGSKYIVVV